MPATRRQAQKLEPTAAPDSRRSPRTRPTGLDEESIQSWPSQIPPPVNQSPIEDIESPPPKQTQFDDDNESSEDQSLSPQFQEELESAPSLASWSSKPSSYETWVPYDLPDAPDDLVIDSWSIIAEGTHGQIRRVETHKGEKGRVLCLKLFRNKWKDMYDRERDAYTLLTHRGVKRCIPGVFFVQEWPRWKFDGNQADNYSVIKRNEILYGVFMEYFEECQEIELRRGTLRLAEILGKTLETIHEAGVIHNDIAEQNILLVRESGKVRIVWIDFSCAWTGRQFQLTRPIEWNTFRGFLFKRMESNGLTLEILNEKFPKKIYHRGDTPVPHSGGLSGSNQSRHSPSLNASAELIPSPASGEFPGSPSKSYSRGNNINADDNLLDESVLFSPSRPSSIPIAYGTFFGAQLVVCLTMFFRSHSVTSFLLLGYTEAVSIAILLLLARDLSLESGLGVRIIYHGLKRGLCQSSNFFDISMGMLYLFWVISGTIAIQKVRRRQLELAD